jgi:hypothetical protein
MTKIQSASGGQTFWTLFIGIWILFVICYLVLGIFFIRELNLDFTDGVSDKIFRQYINR